MPSANEISTLINNSVARVDCDHHSNASDILELHHLAHSPTSQQSHVVQRISHNVNNQGDFPRAQEETQPQRPSMLPRPSSIPRHDNAGPVAWRDLPKKSQLAILTLARLSEPLTQTSLQAYMFYQLRSFDPSLPASTISAQAGLLQGSFSAAQFVTAILWGRMADSEWGGRKRVLLIGLVGTGVSCVGFGFSRTFWQAMVCRTLGGALNGNVGVMRTMISEIIREKRFQSRAFLLLPMCFNIGTFQSDVVEGCC